jgi:putative transposase
MARLSRATIIGYPHQVTQRGNYEQIVFEGEADFRRYLTWLPECAERYSVEVWAYCLMPSHVHYVCVPKAEDSLARAFNTLHMRYAQYFHARKGLTGHLWKGRFLSCILDERSVFEEVRFIENNPVRAGLVARAEDYPWSSARHHVLGETDPVMRDGCFLRGEVTDWRAYLAGGADGLVLKRTWQSLKTGRPAGEESFVRGLEAIAGRRLAARPRGTPRKASKSTGQQLTNRILNSD